MSITLGVSVYPEQESLQQIDEYLKLASSHGFTKVFTSMFSVPGTKEEVADYFRKLTGIVHQYGMKVSGDCNTFFLEKMGADEKNLQPFVDMGIDIIRMDLCYGDERDITLINNSFGVGVEMSAAFVKPIDAAIAGGANTDNLVCCHNFYPERYTGADLTSTMEVNNHWKKAGIRVAMFISSNVEGAHGPWPIQNGLPTLEDHRWITPAQQLKHIIAMDNCDEVLFGNAFASKEEFEQIDEVMKAAYINVPVYEGTDDAFGPLSHFLPHGDITRIPFSIEMVDGVTDLERKVLDFPLHSAGEYVYYMIRSRATRMIYKKEDFPVRPCDQSMFHRGDVVIVNDNCRHYHGELQIVLKDMKNDGQRNLIGRIPEEEMILLDHFVPGTRFCIMR